MPFTGELLALTTVLCWSISVQFFEAASRRVGSLSVNTIRIVIALALFCLFLMVRDGTIIPAGFPARAWFYLSLSGIVGFFIGDLFLFMALVHLGPRLAMLVHSLAAPATAIIGWLVLDESYRISQWLGIFIALSGVGLVILERSPESTTLSLQVRSVTLKGLALGAGALLGQSVGYIFSKIGMQSETGYLDAFSSTQIRAIAAFFCFSAFLTVTKRWGAVRNAVRDEEHSCIPPRGRLSGRFSEFHFRFLFSTTWQPASPPPFCPWCRFSCSPSPGFCIKSMSHSERCSAPLLPYSESTCWSPDLPLPGST